VGELDEARLICVVLKHLRSFDTGTKLGADYWRQAQTLQVTRRELCSTDAGKILPLHILKKQARKKGSGLHI